MITFRTIRLRKRYLLVILAAALVAWAAGAWPSRHTARQTPIRHLPVMADGSLEAVEPSRPGDVVADFTLSTVDGSPLSLSSFLGRPVVLYFWASWCPYCTREMPELNRLQEQFGKDGPQILAINILEQRDKVQSVARDLGLAFPVLLDEDARITRRFEIRATPTYILIDKDGVYRDTIVGSPRPGVLEAKLKPLL